MRFSGYPLLMVLAMIIYLFPGFHDPWKPDETYSFGLVYHILQTGDWVVPTLAGEPFMEKPPLFFLVASVTARLFSPLLALPDAARLASSLFMVVSLVGVALTGRLIYGRGWSAAALFLMSLGLFEFAHYLVTDMALLAGFSVAFYGLALGLARPRLAGFFCGTGLGMGFMSKGLLPVGIIGLTVLLLPFLTAAWRQRSYWSFAVFAGLAAAPWLFVWPAALFFRDQELFMTWFWVNNWGRFLGLNSLGPSSTGISSYYNVLPWLLLPSWPLALVTLWRRRTASEWRMPLLFFLVILVVLGVAADARQLYALPLLVPVAVLAAGSVETLSFWRPLNGIVCFLLGGLLAVLWGLWIALEIGWPVAIVERLQAYQPGYVYGLNWWWVLVPAIATGVWLVLVLRPTPGWEFVLSKWLAGMAVLWLVVACLWVPYLDTGKSYRQVMMAVKEHLGGASSVASCNLGEPQRAMLHYFAGVLPMRLENDPRATNRFVLVQANRDRFPIEPGVDWKLLWRGSRPGDRRETYCLYERPPASAPAKIAQPPANTALEKGHWLLKMFSS